MDHTVLPANTPCLPFLRSVHQRSPLVQSRVADLQLQLTTPLSTHQLQVKRWTGKVRRRKTDTLTTLPRHQAKIVTTFAVYCVVEKFSKNEFPCMSLIVTKVLLELEVLNAALAC